MKKIKLWLINVLPIKALWSGIFVRRGMEKLWILPNMLTVTKQMFINYLKRFLI